MDFYHHQDLARRNTALLVVLLILAVTALIAVTVVFTTLFIHYFQLGSGIHLEAAESGQNLWHLWLSRLNLQLVGGVSVVIIATVVIASQLKAKQLRRGGEAVAAALDGRLLSRDLASPQQSVLLNVVEEMAIASGMPVPAVYLFDEPAINAFAAGYRPTDAVIGITQGALDALTREQLQGVIAHEFSHILHGDMRLNMRLISLLSGITIIGGIGQLLMRSSGSGVHRRSDKNNRMGFLVFGLGLVIIGFAGTVFGKIITAATSRQREFLADASAVQYTRNPNGIAGALSAIQNNTYGSQWQHHNALEFSHLFFGQAAHSWMNRVFATHPPLAQRIARLQQGRPLPTPSSSSTPSQFTPQPNNSPDSADLQSVGFAPFSAGLLTPKTLEQAQVEIAGLPNFMVTQSSDIFSARAIIYGILLSVMHTSDRAQAFDYLRKRSHPAVFKRLNKTATTTLSLTRSQHWLLLLETLPTLKQLSGQQKSVFVSNCEFIIRQDKKFTLFEWCLSELVKQSCMPSDDSIVRALTPNQLTQPLSQLLSFVAHSNWVNLIEPAKRYAELTQPFPQVQLIDKAVIQFSMLSNSLDKLRYLQPLQKPKLLKVIVAIMREDGKITDNELMLLRTLSLCLDCPGLDDMLN